MKKSQTEVTQVDFPERIKLSRYFPGSLHIDLTNHCDKQCRMCFMRDRYKEKIFPLGHMDFDLYKAIIDECAMEYKGQMNIHLYKDGESLLYRRLGDAINYAKQYGMKTHLATNGNLLYERRKEAISLDEIIISTEDDSAMESLAKFMEYRGSREKPFVQMKVFMNDDWWDKDKEYPIDAMLVNKHYIETREPTNMNGACYHLFYNPAITWEGLMTVCCGDWRREGVVGSVKYDTVKTLWRIMKFVRMNQKKGHYLPPCDKCQKVESLPKVGRFYFQESELR